MNASLPALVTGNLDRVGCATTPLARPRSITIGSDLGSTHQCGTTSVPNNVHGDELLGLVVVPEHQERSTSPGPDWRQTTLTMIERPPLRARQALVRGHRRTGVRSQQRPVHGCRGCPPSSEGNSPAEESTSVVGFQYPAPVSIRRMVWGIRAGVVQLSRRSLLDRVQRGTGRAVVR